MKTHKIIYYRDYTYAARRGRFVDWSSTNVTEKQREVTYLRCLRKKPKARKT